MDAVEVSNIKNCSTQLLCLGGFYAMFFSGKPADTMDPPCSLWSEE